MIKACKVCGRTDVPLSHRGLCEECGMRRMVKAAVELSEHRGEFYEKWLKRRYPDKYREYVSNKHKGGDNRE